MGAGVGKEGFGGTAVAQGKLDVDRTVLTEFGFRSQTKGRYSGKNSPASSRGSRDKEDLGFDEQSDAVHAKAMANLNNTIAKQYWMSDKNCKECYDCGEPFQFFRRRHHCRVCGQIFCSKCSSQTVSRNLAAGALLDVEPWSGRDGTGNRGGADDSLSGTVRVCKHCYTLTTSLPNITIGPLAEPRGPLNSPPPLPTPTSTNTLNITPSTASLQGLAAAASGGTLVLSPDKRDPATKAAPSNPDSTKSAEEKSDDEEDTAHGDAFGFSGVPNDQEGSGNNVGADDGPQDATEAVKLDGLPFLTEQESSKKEMDKMKGSVVESRLLAAADAHLHYTVARMVEAERLDPCWIEVLIKFAKRACQQVRPSVLRGDKIDIRHYVKVKTVVGGAIADCLYVDGVVFRKNLAHKKMRSTITNPRILLLSCPLQYQRVKNRLSSLDIVLGQEKEYMDIQVRKIVALNPDIVVVQNTVSRLAQDALREANISLLLNVKENLMERLARCTHGPILPSTDCVDPSLHMLGTCGYFKVQSFDTGEIDDGRVEGVRRTTTPSITGARNNRVVLVSFEGCAPWTHATIILRGSDKEQQLKKAKKILKSACHIAYSLALETAMLFDSCATYSPQTLEEQTKAHLKPPPAYIRSGGKNDEDEAGDKRSGLRVGAGKDIGKDIKDKKACLVPLSSSPFIPMQPVPIRIGPDDQTEDPAAVEESLRSRKGKPHTRRIWKTWLHSNIYIGSCWLTATAQCFAPEVKSIDFYTNTDKTLGQFLTENCFDLKLRCLSPKCKRDVLHHSLSYVHGGGRVTVKVKQIAAKLVPPQFFGGAPHPDSQRDDPDGYLGRSNGSGNGAAQQNRILMWSRCKVCKKNVTPYMTMSGQTFNYSFGKFLELAFYNRHAICHTGECPHSVNADHIRFFSLNNLVASVQYQSFPPYKVVTERKLTYNYNVVEADLANEVAKLSVISSLVFQEFLVKISEQEEFVASEFRQPLRALAKRVSAERGIWASCLSSFRLFPSGTKVTPETKEGYLFADHFDVYKFQRRLHLKFAEWNACLCDIARVGSGVGPIPLGPGTAGAAKGGKSKKGDDLEDGTSTVLPSTFLDADGDLMSEKERDREMMKTLCEFDNNPEDNGASGGEASPSGVEEVEPIETVDHEEDDFDSRKKTITDAISEMFKRANSDEPVAPAPVAPGRKARPSPVLTLEELVAHRILTNAAPTTFTFTATNAEQPTQPSGSGANPSGAGATGTTGAAGTMTTMSIALGAEDLEFLSPESTHMHLPKAVAGMVVPVFEDEPSSIIAYSLSSVDHIKALGSFKHEISKSMLAAHQHHHQQQQQSIQARLRALRKDEGDGSEAGARYASGDDSDMKEVDTLIGKFALSRHRARMALASPWYYESDGLSEKGNGSNNNISTNGSNSNSNMGATTGAGSALSGAGRSDSGSMQGLNPASNEHGQQSSGGNLGGNGNGSTDGMGSFGVPASSMGIASAALGDGEEFKGDTSGMGFGMGPDLGVSGSFVNYFSAPAGRSAAGKLSINDLVKHILTVEEPSVHKHRFDDNFIVRGAERATAGGAAGGGGAAASADGPLERTSFLCTTYFPKQFHALRLYYIAGGDYEFIRSLSRCHKWKATGGKSGSTFAMTKDKKFVLKYVSRNEMKMFLECAPNYFSYMAKACFHNLPSVLIKMLGVYQISWKKATDKMGSKYVIVMPNLFHGCDNTSIMFDLKGSIRNRYVKSQAKEDEAPVPGAAAAGEESVVVKQSSDKQSANDKQSNDKPSNKQAGEKSLHDKTSDKRNSDSKQASDRQPTDKQASNNASAEGAGPETIQGEPWQPEGPSNLGVGTGAPVPATAGGDPESLPAPTVKQSRTLLDQNFLEYTKGYPLSLDEQSKTSLRMAVWNDTLFLTKMAVVDYSMLVGIDETNGELYLGIIDYIRQYTWDKRLETGVKSVGMIAGKSAPTVISPQNYKSRFRTAMDRYFMIAPEQTSLMTMPGQTGTPGGVGTVSSSTKPKVKVPGPSNPKPVVIEPLPLLNADGIDVSVKSESRAESRAQSRAESRAQSRAEPVRRDSRDDIEDSKKGNGRVAIEDPKKGRVTIEDPKKFNSRNTEIPDEAAKPSKPQIDGTRKITRSDKPPSPSRSRSLGNKQKSPRK